MLTTNGANGANGLRNLTKFQYDFHLNYNVTIKKFNIKICVLHIIYQID